MDDHLLERARAGDEHAFRALTEPHRRELHVHCYRMLGSVQDAEDVVQDTLLAAWRGLEGFEGRASFRAWLYRIATNRCLNVLRDAGRRPQTVPDLPPPHAEPTRTAEPTWLEPYPDRLLEGLADEAAAPDAVYEAKEAISLAFVGALQRLPPHQRAALVLRDVLGFRAAEAGQMLEVSEATVNSALQRARSSVATLSHDRLGQRSLPASPRERALVERFAEAFEAGDVPEVVSVLAEDGWLRMPPQPQEFKGAEAAGCFLETRPIWDDGRWRRTRTTRANGDPAVAYYVGEPGETMARASGIVVLTVEGDRVASMTRFGIEALSWFGLPEAVPA